MITWSLHWFDKFKIYSTALVIHNFQHIKHIIPKLKSLALT